MKEQQTYPEYIGASDVSTRSYELMRVERYMDGQASLLFVQQLFISEGGMTPEEALVAAVKATA